MMTKKIVTFLIMTLPLFAQAQMKFQPPTTPKIPVNDTLHGHVLTDNYQWLEDKENPQTIAWTKAQHDYTIAYLKATQKTHPGLRDDIANYVDLDYEGPISKVGIRLFQTMKKKGDKQSKIYTLLAGKKVLIWDPVKIDTSGNTATAGVDYTYDGNKAAIRVQKSGAEISTLYIIDTRTGNILHGPFDGIMGFQWTKDQEHAYLTFRTQENIDNQTPLKTYRWVVSDDIENLEFIGTTNDAKNSFYIYDNRYSDVTFYGEGDFYSNKLYIKPTGSNSDGELIYESTTSNAYPEAIEDKLYIMTNDNAPNFKLMVANKDKPHFKDWKTLIPESETVMQSYVVTKHNVIVQDKKDIQSRLTIYDFNGKKLKQLQLPEVGNVSGISYDREEDSIYVSLATFTSTTKTFVASPKDFKWRLFYQRVMPIDMSNIVGEILFYKSKDGTKVPVFVVHRKDMKLNGNNPVLLNAYGGFNSGIAPGYFGFYASFINRGGIVVQPGIRGGDEYGEQWHLDGMLDKKQNSFDDFYACAEWLINEKYTNTNRIVAMGGSNGGLLMGAAATQRPDLFKAIVCQVPLLDMIRFQKFLIARYWIPEYGTSDTAKDYEWLIKYSPYHNIKDGENLPTMLVTAGANDTRVDALHAKKFVAAAQNHPGQKNPIMLYIDFNSGHGSGKSTEHTINEWNFTFEFIMNQLGM